MTKPKLLLVAYRAIGDWLYACPVLPYLFEKFDVYLDCSRKVFTLAHDDPRFKKVAVCPVEELPEIGQARTDALHERWEKLINQIGADEVINLNGTLEMTCIAERFQPEFHKPVGERRAIFGSNGFYDAIFGRIGMQVPNPLNLEGLYFSEKEIAWAEGWKAKHKDNFIVILLLTGTTIQKRFTNALEVANRILALYPEALVYMAGDESCSSQVPTDNPRIKNMCGERVAIKQAVLMTKYVDCVVGPETFMLVAAGMWGTPKIILANTSSVYQMTQYQKNDFSIQAPIWCSPCHRAIYSTEDCESMLQDEKGQPLYPACTQRFAVEPIMERIQKSYELRRKDIHQTVRG